MNDAARRPIALVTGASSGIGFHVAPGRDARVVAEQHRRMAEPGSAKD